MPEDSHPMFASVPAEPADVVMKRMLSAIT
jgi:hypothetical protein